MREGRCNHVASWLRTAARGEEQKETKPLVLSDAYKSKAQARKK